jgi:membrane associated rhomboid family serine protease
MSYQQYRPASFKILPPVVKNLLIINGLFFLATWVFESQYKIDLTNYLGLHYFTSEYFRPYQLITYMFMHGGIDHIFFNMFALWMFGNTLENFWGPKRFLIFYMVTGIGAGVIQLLVVYFRLMPLYSQVPPETLNIVMTKGSEILDSGKNFIDPIAAQINLLVNSSTIGASGAIFGVLLAFGMLFPNTLLYVYFLIPIKAKYFVIVYGAIELYMGISNNSGDNVAHFAHLGGMLFGFVLIKYWQKKSNRFY